jgi:nucleoside-diphosphate-sugar epimerase
MEKTALVLGATGGVGGEIARALAARGWKVRALARRPMAQADGFESVVGDALDAGAVRRVSDGAAVIVHAVNPPGYRNWGQLVLPMLDNSIAAARATGARVALPGTIYNYDPRQTPVAVEDTPQHPATRKGKIRAELEQRLGAVKSLVLRAGDFFGPRPGNNWLSQGMVTPGKPVKSILYPGAKGVGHNWAYLPDVGETFARLLDREAGLPEQARFHFEGYWDPEGTAFVAALREAAGNPRAKVRRLPWALLPLLAPFNPTMREMIEMRIYWDHPLKLDNRALVSFLGEEPHTPLVEALRITLQALRIPVGSKRADEERSHER